MPQSSTALTDCHHTSGFVDPEAEGRSVGLCTRSNNFLNQFEALREFNPANSVLDVETYRAHGLKVDFFY